MDFVEYVQNVKLTGRNHRSLHAQDLDSRFRKNRILDFKAKEIAKDLFELASEQRLEILFRLKEEKSTVSVIAKNLGATMPEVFRNFDRLVKSGLIEKNIDGSYHLTLYGQTACAQIPSLVLVSHQKKYFEKHEFGSIPTKFLQRIGSLHSGEYIKGFVKTQEVWREIHSNAAEYIYNILPEVPYSSEIIEIVAEKAKKHIPIHSIFSEDTVIPKDRKKNFEKYGFKEFIEQGIIERKMRKDVKIAVLLNEKEGGIMFPTKDGESDIGDMLYSNKPEFHEWCLDYFKYCWESSGSFQEGKLK